MATLMSVTSRQYSPRTITLTPTIQARAAIRISLTRENWPAGAVGSLSIASPDGDELAAVGFTGGQATNKDGTPRTVQVLELRDLEAGQYTVKAVILQTLRTAVIVEGL